MQRVTMRKRQGSNCVADHRNSAGTADNAGCTRAVTFDWVPRR
jgi:hypothetical protein